MISVLLFFFDNKATLIDPAFFLAEQRQSVKILGQRDIMISKETLENTTYIPSFCMKLTT